MMNDAMTTRAGRCAILLGTLFLLTVTEGAAAPAADLACGQEPGNRFFWVERAFCDLDSNPPEQAAGVVIWNHGLRSTMEQWRVPVPPAFRLLQLHGWEVVAVKRHHLAEANGATWSLDRAVQRTLDEVRQRRAQGYRKVVLAGQSFGGYITLEAAEQVPELFAAIAMAPGVRSIGVTGPRAMNLSVIDRSLQRVKADRIALVFPANDALFGDFPRGVIANRILAARHLPYWLLDETSGLTGHGGGTGGQFVLRYGTCLREFLVAPTLRPERFVCSATKPWPVVREVLLPRAGLPRLALEPEGVPAGLRTLAGRWYGLLGDTLVFFALVEGPASAPRVVYRRAGSAVLEGGVYDAVIEEGAVRVQLPDRGHFVVTPGQPRPTLTWTSENGAHIMRATLAAAPADDGSIAPEAGSR